MKKLKQLKLYVDKLKRVTARDEKNLKELKKRTRELTKKIYKQNIQIAKANDEIILLSNGGRKLDILYTTKKGGV